MSMAAGPRHVIYFDPYGHLYAGTQRSVKLIAERLPEYGYSAEVVLTRAGLFADRLRDAGIACTVVDAPRELGHYGGSTRGRRSTSALLALPSYVSALARQLRVRPGIVHMTSQRGVLLGAPAARRARLPCVWHVAVVEERRFTSALCDTLVNRTLGVAKVVRVPSARFWADQRVIPAPLDPRFLDAPAVAPSDPPTIVTSTRIEPMKNLDLLIDALAALRRWRSDVRLRIIGDTQEGHESYKEALLVQARRLGLDGAVEITGWVDRPEEHWRNASAYVQASTLDGSPQGVIEAMSCRLPVVITSSIGLAEEVVHRQSAMVVSPGAPGALVSAIREVLEDRAFARGLGARGREVALTRYSCDAVVRDLVQVYDSMFAS